MTNGEDVEKKDHGALLMGMQAGAALIEEFGESLNKNRNALWSNNTTSSIDAKH